MHPLEATPETHRGWHVVARVAVVVVAAVSLQVFGPTLVVVYTSLGDVVRINPLWLVVITGCECASFVCLWQLIRLVIRSASWGVVARAQLVGNAVGQVVPGGAATGAAMQMRMLTVSGIDRVTVVSSLTVVGLLTSASVFVTPVFALPAVLAISDVSRELVLAAGMGVAGSVLLGAALGVFLVSTRPVVAVAAVVQSLANTLLFRRRPLTGLPERLLRERDLIRARLEDRKGNAVLAASGNVAFDFLALLAALAAVGARPNPGLVLLAFVAAKLLGLIPFTPGGLGFVEGGLISTLTLADIPSGQAVVATATYRAVSYLLPILAGASAYVWSRIDPTRWRRLRRPTRHP
jgi:uncharacterized membrane protein YbhN (UPF0104 family)